MPTKPIKRIADLVPDDRNANRGTERGATMVEHSLRTYGAGRSILIVKNGEQPSRAAANAARARRPGRNRARPSTRFASARCLP
jgi:hypothetical protein